MFMTQLRILALSVWQELKYISSLLISLVGHVEDGIGQAFHVLLVVVTVEFKSVQQFSEDNDILGEDFELGNVCQTIKNIR